MGNLHGIIIQFIPLHPLRGAHAKSKAQRSRGPPRENEVNLTIPVWHVMPIPGSWRVVCIYLNVKPFSRDDTCCCMFIMYLDLLNVFFFKLFSMVNHHWTTNLGNIADEFFQPPSGSQEGVDGICPLTKKPCMCVWTQNVTCFTCRIYRLYRMYSERFGFYLA